MDRYNIGGTSYSTVMNDKTNQYNILIRKAEITNRDNDGKPTKEEGNFYREAMQVCSEIINMNLAQRAVVNLWTGRKKLCEAEVERIVRALLPPPAPKAEKEPEAPKENRSYNGKAPDNKPAVKDSSGYTVTSSGFKTKNACKEVPAEAIEKWYLDKPDHSIEDVIGMEDVKRKLMDEAGSLGWDETDEALGISPVKCFLFYGPPGTGKTYIIEAFTQTMMEKGFKYICLFGGQIKQGLVGAAEKTIQAAIQEAIDNEPCVIFIDEFDNVCANRNKPNIQSHESSLTTAFLTAFNTLLSSHKRVIFMGATNYPNDVDEAMLDRLIMMPIPLPDEDNRKNYFEQAFKMMKLEDGLSFEEMADRTDNYSYRDLRRVTDPVKQAAKSVSIRKVKAAMPDAGQKEIDAAAAKIIKDGEIVLTRQMLEDSMRDNPPSSKAGVRAALEAFESKLRNLG